MLTRSEIWALSKKACRGAGFSWGMAEEAAQATIRIYASGGNGFAALLEVLDQADGKTHPLPLTGEGPICGLTFAVYHSDCGGELPSIPKSLVGREIALAILQKPEGKANWPKSAPSQIEDYANRTYVPESEESRLRGAGEG